MRLSLFLSLAPGSRLRKQTTLSPSQLAKPLNAPSSAKARTLAATATSYPIAPVARTDLAAAQLQRCARRTRADSTAVLPPASLFRAGPTPAQEHAPTRARLIATPAVCQLPTLAVRTNLAIAQFPRSAGWVLMAYMAVVL